jgi:hypothetical protein
MIKRRIILFTTTLLLGSAILFPQTGEERLSRLFEGLSSSDNNAAMKAYIELTEADPEAILRKIPKYRMHGIMGKFNRRLPLFAMKFLPQQAVFTQYCRANNIIYKPSAALKEKLDTLRGKLAYGKRYGLENQLLAQMTIADIAPIEYYGTLYGSQANRPLSCSVSRILEIFYDTHWKDIVNTPKQLRFYLKKSDLFFRLGILGKCRKYLERFNGSSPHTLSRLEALLEKETDPQTREQIIKVLNHESNTRPGEGSKKDVSNKIPLNEFLSNLSNYGTGVIHTVHIDETDREKNYIQIFDALNRASGREDIQKLLELLRANLDIEMTRFLIGALEKIDEIVIDSGSVSRHDIQRKQHGFSYDILAADWIVAFLEFLHGHGFPLPPDPEPDPGVKIVSTSSTRSAWFRYRHKTAPQWKGLWKKDAANYKSWGLRFYKEKLKAVADKKNVTIEEINGLLESKYYRPEHKPVLFGALKKVSPSTGVAGLSIKKGTLPVEDLKYFKGIVLYPHGVRDIVWMFADIGAPAIMDYIKSVSAGYGPEQVGHMYDTLLYDKAFRELLDKVPPGESERNGIIDALGAYREKFRPGDNQLTYIDWYVFFLRHLGAPLEAQLKTLPASDFEKKTKEAICADILGRANYEQLGVILKYYHQLPISDYQRDRYVSEDFGILIPAYSPEVLTTLRKHYAEKKEYDLYDYYLSKAGFDYKTEDGALDYKKIYRVLKYDITEGFVGSGHRNEHVMSMIKLLELTFNTRLGQPRKFNNIIQNRGYFTPERVRLWMDFLKKEKLVTARKKQ